LIQYIANASGSQARGSSVNWEDAFADSVELLLDFVAAEFVHDPRVTFLILNGLA
jgi:hypothetical protein